METVLKESRVFDPPKAFTDQAWLSDPKAYALLREQATADPVSFWEKAALETLTWATPWTQAFNGKPMADARWFEGGKLNAAYNCLDRHLERNASKLALVWEGEDGTSVKWTYAELHDQVCRLANALEKRLGLKTGDTAALYLPLVPEAVVAMLACARVGITHSVIFGGFSAQAIQDRVQDAQCKVVFTADEGSRRGQRLELGKTVMAAASHCPSIQNVIVLQRSKKQSLPKNWLDWNELCAKQSSEHEARDFDSEHPLFFLYTSGTTGKPKGIVHSTGGYLTAAALTSKWVFDLKPKDVYWCTADIGWVTGHSYVVYGPLANAATVFLYEGALNYPDAGRIWKLIEKYRISILYTAPTAIRSFMREGDSFPASADLSSLRLLGSVGEPINPEAWIWYHSKIGAGRCPVVDTWWQTETGAILISGVPGVVPQKPGSASLPFPGIVADIVDENGRSCSANEGGYLVVRHPWPSMLRGIHKDRMRFEETYLKRFPGTYFTGDGAHRDEQGYFWIKGRVDDVLNVSGHRLGTMEIESALVSHPSVAEAAVVGRPDDLKGQAVVAFVIPRVSSEGLDTKALIQNLKKHVTQEIGSIARPDDIVLTRVLPKTRSGKIMRRLLRDLAAGRKNPGDTTTLENPGLIDVIE